MVEDDFTQLNAFLAVAVVEVELDLLRVTVDLWERNHVPVVHTKVQLSESDFVPSTSKHVPGEDADFGGRHSGMVTSTLEADASKHQLFSELDFDP